MPDDSAVLDAHLPEYHHRARYSIETVAPPEVVYPIARNLDLSGSWLTRSLLAARGLGRHTRLGDLERIGFTLLAEDPPNGFVHGVIGRFWRPSGELVDFDRESFPDFARSGFAKAAWSFEIMATETGAGLSTETRVLCLDEASRRSFLRYWRLIGPFSGLIRKEALRVIKTQAEGHL
ncbi:MAG TPA: hypothetical protein VGC03_07965 [Acidimicrobiia bacterium]